jgi:tetratricopeptide (TPR) repeat protein
VNRSTRVAGDRPIPSSVYRASQRPRWLLVLLLFALAVGLWARAPLHHLWLNRQSVTSLAAYVPDHPAEAEPALLLAERYLDSGQPASAEPVLLRLIEQEPANARAWLLRSQAEFQQGKLAAAYASLQVAMPFLARSPEARWRLGLLRERRGDEAGAEAEFHRAVALDPGHVEARLELARGALSERHYGEALKHLEVAVRREPRNPMALEALALAHRGLGHLDQAERYAREEVRLAPQSSRSWRTLGQALQDRATAPALREAEQAYRRALQLEPGSSELHHQLGMISFSRGDYAAAATELQRAIDLQPLNRLAYPALMQCYRRLGRSDRAERLQATYRKIDEMDLATAPLEYSIWAMPDNTALRMRLARLYVRYHRPDLARTQVERVIELNPNHAEARRLQEQLKVSRP